MHHARSVLGYVPETVYGDPGMYVTGAVEHKKKDIGIKTRNFGGQDRDHI